MRAKIPRLYGQRLRLARICHLLIHHVAFDVRFSREVADAEILFNSDRSKDRLYVIALSDSRTSDAERTAVPLRLRSPLHERHALALVLEAELDVANVLALVRGRWECGCVVDGEVAGTFIL